MTSKCSEQLAHSSFKRMLIFSTTERQDIAYVYSETCFKGPLKKNTKIWFPILIIA